MYVSYIHDETKFMLTFNDRVKFLI
jgi:hypothetical protein